MLKQIFSLLGNTEKADLSYTNPEIVKNILIVRQHNQLGDMLCSVPLFAAVRKKYPEAHITLVASPINYEILYSDINPFIDKVITYQKSTAKDLMDFYKELKNHTYQIGIVPSTVSISRTSHLINYFSGAKIRAGVNSIDEKINSVSYLLNVKSDFRWNERKLHQVDRNLEVGAQFGCMLTEDEKRQVMIHLSSDEISFAKNFINENFPDKEKMIIAFHPGAGKIPNRWSKENFISLMRLFHEKHNCYLLMTSGTIDKEITDSIKKELSELSIDCKILENTPVRKVGAVIKSTDLYVTNDTGTMHVAGGVDANVVSLFGPTHGYEWAPAGKNKVFIQSESGNIDDIKTEEVFRVSENLLNEFVKDKKTILHEK